MSTAGPDPRPWPRFRWYLIIVLVFAGQIGLIFAFGDRKPVVPRQPGFVPEFHLSTNSGEMLALKDPTLFALPNLHGFSASAWLGSTDIKTPVFEWSEPERWLPLPLDQLGAALTLFMQTNVFPPFAFEFRRAPQWHSATTTNEAAAPQQTRLDVEGDLAQRPLLSSPALPVPPLADVLQDSIVQIFVDEAGNVMSTALLPPGSGSMKVDQQALQLAKDARFAPQPQSEDVPLHWMPGTLIFHWATAPVATNNLPAPQ